MEKKTSASSKKIQSIIGYGIILAVFIGFAVFYVHNARTFAKITADQKAVETALSGMAGDMKALGEMMQSSDAKEKAKKYQEILQDISTGFEKIADINAKGKDIESKLEEIKTLTKNSKDQATRDSAAKFVDLAGQNSQINIALAGEMKQISEIAQTYYQALAAGQKASMPEAQLNKIGAQMQKDLASASQIGKNYDSADADLSKALIDSTKK
jgi:uncharacterized protein YoxC